MAINNVSGNTLLQSGFFPPVRVASTGSPLTPTTGGLLTVDGVTLVAGDRVLCKDETSATSNGIYAANTGPWVRTSDASGNQQFFSGMAVICAQGAANAKTIFICTCTDNPVVVGTSLISFSGQLPVGAGNVVGPGSSTTGDVATFSGVTGQLLQDTSTSGTGPVLKANSPTLVSPTLGSASATAVNNVVITQPASTATLTLASSTVFTVNNSLTLSATSGKTVTFNASTTFSGVDAKTLTIENTLDFAGTDSTRFIFPSVNDTVVGITAVQNIYNKTLTGAAITSGTATNVTFVGGTINNAVIGGVTAAAGTFTAITATTCSLGVTTATELIAPTAVLTNVIFTNLFTPVTSLTGTSGTLAVATFTTISASGSFTATLPPPTSSNGEVLFILNQVAQTCVNITSNIVPTTTTTATSTLFVNTAGKWALLVANSPSNVWQTMMSN